MTAVLLWKVYYEQRLTWAVMAALALAFLLLDVTFLETWPPDRPVLVAIFCIIAYLYGVIVAPRLLAGEKEASTVPSFEQRTVW
jgi:hypothetical protein